MQRTFYTVVENAGYEGEQDVKTFRDMFAAFRWIEKHYADGETETLHVCVCQNRDGKREYI